MDNQKVRWVTNEDMIFAIEVKKEELDTMVEVEALYQAYLTDLKEGAISEHNIGSVGGYLEYLAKDQMPSGISIAEDLKILRNAMIWAAYRIQENYLD